MALSFGRVGVLVLGVVTAITLTPVASYAETWSHDDPTNDMVRVVDGDTGETTPATEVTTADVISTSARLGPYWLRLRTTFGDLTVVDGNTLAAGVWRINTRSGRKLLAGGIADSASPKGQWFLERRIAGDEIRCPRKKHSIDYTAHTMTLWIPARCLGYPRWVRVGAGGAFLDSADETYLDDAQRDGTVADAGFDNLTLGPRVHRW